MLWDNQVAELKTSIVRANSAQASIVAVFHEKNISFMVAKTPENGKSASYNRKLSTIVIKYIGLRKHSERQFDSEPHAPPREYFFG